MAEAVNRASACSLKIHEAMAGYLAVDDPDPKNRVYLSLHMGIGCGKLTAVHVGGVFKRWEYILSGPPMLQVWPIMFAIDELTVVRLLLPSRSPSQDRRVSHHKPGPSFEFLFYSPVAHVSVRHNSPLLASL